MAHVDAEVRAQLGHELAAHRRAPVGVNRELGGADPLLDARRVNQAPSQAGVLGRGDHPTHDVPTEEVEDHIQRVIQVGDRPLQLRDIPRPDLIGGDGDEFRFPVRRMPRLMAPLADLGAASMRYIVRVEQR